MSHYYDLVDDDRAALEADRQERGRIDAARQAGYDAGFTEGREKGHAEGFAAGIARARAALLSEGISRSQARLHAAAEMLGNQNMTPQAIVSYVTAHVAAGVDTSLEEQVAAYEAERLAASGALAKPRLKHAASDPTSSMWARARAAAGMARQAE